MDRKDFFDENVHSDLSARIAGLTAETEPRWGTMNAAQMCAHCSEVLEVAGGKSLDGTPWFVKLFGRLIKRLVLSGKPYPRSTRTHPQYVIPDSVGFDRERDRLVDLVRRLYAEGPARAAETTHPLFGRMTPDEAGWGMYKHLDHHLTQFGV